MNPSAFLGIGECMVELSEREDGLIRRSFAGDVFNTLWYAAQALRPDWSTGFLSAVGSDPLSGEMLAFIEAANIDTGLVRRIPDRRPGLYMIHLDDGERSFSYWRDNSAARLLASDKAHLEQAADSASVLYFSGITLAILSGEDTEKLLDCLATARSRGKTVAFDPNIRPALWSDPARMREVIGRAAEHATIVMPSFDDEAKAFGDTDAGETVSRYLACGPDLVVLKDGAGDVSVRGKGGEMRTFPTPSVVKPVDSTGAGDSFNGAFLAEFVQSGDVAAAVAAGQTCAAEVIGHHGALIGRTAGS